MIIMKYVPVKSHKYSMLQTKSKFNSAQSLITSWTHSHVYNVFQTPVIRLVYVSTFMCCFGLLYRPCVLEMDVHFKLSFWVQAVSTDNRLMFMCSIYLFFHIEYNWRGKSKNEHFEFCTKGKKHRSLDPFILKINYLTENVDIGILSIFLVNVESNIGDFGPFRKT
jgi:hypothetical protein